MSQKDALYDLANRDVSLSRTFNNYMSSRSAETSKGISESMPLITMLADHVSELNAALQHSEDDVKAYAYLSERIIYWSNILIHEFEFYVDFNIPSPRSLFDG